MLQLRRALTRLLSSTQMAMAFAAIALITAGCASSRTPSVRTDPRPNVLIILLDDAGYGDLGCHGNRDVQTPTLDQLWSESTRMTRYCSQPVCTPTRACLMTG